MYEATPHERKVLEANYNYTRQQIDLLDAESDKVRRGIPVSLSAALAICEYQSRLQGIKKTQKRWWQFWK